MLWSIGGTVAFCALATACTAGAAHTASAAHTVPVPCCEIERERERDGGVSPMSNCNHNMPAGYGITTAVCTAMPVCHSTAVRTPYPLGFYSSSRQGGVGGAGQSHRHVVMGFTDDSTQPTVCYGSGRVHSTLTGNWHLDRRTHRMGLCGVRQASQSGGLSAAGRGGDSH